MGSDSAPHETAGRYRMFCGQLQPVDVQPVRLNVFPMGRCPARGMGKGSERARLEETCDRQYIVCLAACEELRTTCGSRLGRRDTASTFRFGTIGGRRIDRRGPRRGRTGGRFRSPASASPSCLAADEQAASRSSAFAKANQIRDAFRSHLHPSSTGNSRRGMLAASPPHAYSPEENPRCRDAERSPSCAWESWSGDGNLNARTGYWEGKAGCGDACPDRAAPLRGLGGHQ